jgi:hypothetical protein
MVQRPSFSKSTRSVKSRMETLGTSRTSVRIILLSSCRAPYQHVKTRHTVNGKPASVTLPTQVAPGDYLVRHEIIALHLAMTLGGAEFYPSCTQIRVGGSQTGTPNQTVSFPGAYNDNDPGIYDPSIYSPGAPYTFPGGPVSNLASPADMTGQLSGNGTSSSPAGNSSSSSTAKNGKPSATNGAGSGAQPTGIAQSPLSRVCKLQKRDAVLSRRDMGIAQHKRHMSFMRAIRDVFYHS